MSLRHRLQASHELWRRYYSVFRHFWTIRRSLKNDFFNQDEAQFLPAALALQEAPDSKSLRWTGRALMLIVVFALLWSIFGRMDIIVNATGKVIPSARTKTIASVDVSSVKALHVREGQVVRAGDVLIELDSSSSDAEHDKASDTVAQARLQAARASALILAVQNRRAPNLPAIDGVERYQWEAVSHQLDGQYQDFMARLRRMDEEIARYGAALPLASQRALDYQALVADQTVSRHAWLEREQARIDLKGQLAEAISQRASLIAQTLKEAHDARIEATRVIESAQQDQRRAREHSRLLKLIAPVSGTVQQLNVHTVGGVVAAAQPLMQIVPEDTEVEVEAFLENRDVGFLQVGQEARIKIDAFDYTKYGTLAARVRHVSRDAIPDEKRGLLYSTKIVLDKNTLVVDGKSLPVLAGMSVSVEIKTGTRRVIEYVLSPLMRHQRETLNER